MAADTQRAIAENWQRSQDGNGRDAELVGRADAPDVTNPPFNVEAVFELCLGQAAFAASLIHSFQQDSEAHLVTLREHALQADGKKVSSVAHALKGSAAIVSAGEVRRLAAAIQTAGDQGHLEEVRGLVDPLAREIKRCRDYLPVVGVLARNAESHLSDEQNDESIGS